jgi:dUTP pyrophosphatase
MTKATVKVEKMYEGIVLPHYAHGAEGDAGLDLRAWFGQEDMVLMLSPGETALVGTGLKIALPPGFEAQIRSRSGMAYKRGLIVLNSPATIDPSYRGEVKVMLKNTSQGMQTVGHRERIAQMVVAPYAAVQWDNVDKVEDTDRGEGGFGSTGVA